MEKFNFINKDRTRAKVFKLFKDVNNYSPFLDAMGISCLCVYKRADKPIYEREPVKGLRMQEKNIRNY